MKKKLIIIIVVVVLLLAIGAGVFFIFFYGKDKEPEAIEPDQLFEFEVGKIMTYIGKDSNAKSKKTKYVQCTPIISYADEETLQVLEKKKSLITSEIEKYFNNRKESQIVRMRGKNVEDGKDRIEIDLEQKIKDVLGDSGKKVYRVVLLGFVIN